MEFLKKAVVCLSAVFALAAPRVRALESPPPAGIDISGSWEIEGYGTVEVRACDRNQTEREKFCIYARRPTAQAVRLLKLETQNYCDVEVYRGLERQEQDGRWTGGDVVNSASIFAPLVKIEVDLEASGDSFRGRGYAFWPLPEKRFKGVRLGDVPSC